MWLCISELEITHPLSSLLHMQTLLWCEGALPDSDRAEHCPRDRSATAQIKEGGSKFAVWYLPNPFSDGSKAPSLSLLEQICLKGPSLNEGRHIRTLVWDLLLQQLSQAQSSVRAGPKMSTCKTFLFSNVPHCAQHSESMTVSTGST